MCAELERAHKSHEGYHDDVLALYLSMEGEKNFHFFFFPLPHLSQVVAFKLFRSV